MSPPATLRECLARELPRLYGVAYAMCGDRVFAERLLLDLVRTVAKQGEAAVLSTPDPSLALLAALVRDIEDKLGRRSDHTFESLDQLLRSDITRPIDLRGDVTEDAGKVHLLLWELKRNCLTATLSALPPGVRLSFVLTDLLGLSPAEASDLLGIKESAYRVRLTRARKRLEDYLAPRCTHVDRQNPCTCRGRLMIAHDAGFVTLPANPSDIPHEPHDSEAPRRDVGGLYRGLPQVRLSESELRRLLAETHPGA